MNSVRNTSTTFKITPAEIKLEKVGNLNHPTVGPESYIVAHNKGTQQTADLHEINQVLTERP